MTIKQAVPENMDIKDNSAVNRGFYDVLWSETHLERPDRFNT